MKDLITFLILITTLFYLGGVVIGAAFSPFAWEEDTRLGLSCFWLLCCVIGSGLIGMNNSVKNEKKGE